MHPNELFSLLKVVIGAYLCQNAMKTAVLLKCNAIHPLATVGVLIAKENLFVDPLFSMLSLLALLTMEKVRNQSSFLNKIGIFVNFICTKINVLKICIAC